MSGPPGGRRNDDRFRLARLARGLSQSALAEAAGVTRQAISGVESGRWSPSLEVALAIAQALGRSVEELFGPAPSYPATAARLAGESLPGDRLLVAMVGSDQVAYPLRGDNSFVPGFRPASALAIGPDATVVGAVQPFASPAPVVAVAGCDPALALLAGPLGRRRPPLGLAWWSCPNATGIDLLRKGMVHAAALHRRAEAAPPDPDPVPDPEPEPGDEVSAEEYERIGLARWREGLVVAPELVGEVATLAEGVRRGLRLANREPGSEARRILDDALAGLGIDGTRVPGYGTRCTAHLLVASAIAAGLADFGVASEPAALSYGLGFVPWQDEICELWVARRRLGDDELVGLLEVLAGDELPAQLAAIPGCDATPCGRVLG